MLISGDNAKDIDEEVAKEWEHTILQDTMDKELNDLNKRLEQKEVIWKLVSCIISFVLLLKLLLQNSAYC